MSGHPQSGGGTEQHHLSVVIGAEDSRSGTRGQRDRARRRMAVGVALADRDDRDPRMDRGEQVRVLMRRAVVRHLQDVGGQVRVRGEDRGLRRRFDVAGEQEADRAVPGRDRDLEDDTGVVRAGAFLAAAAGAGAGAGAIRPESAAESEGIVAGATPVRTVAERYVAFARENPGLFAMTFHGGADAVRDLVTGRLAFRRPGAGLALWSAMHGVAMLAMDGSLSMVSEAEQRTCLAQVVNIFLAGLEVGVPA